jgi:hypothetical protein
MCVQYRDGNSGENLNTEWHVERWKAISENFSLDEFGPIDIEQYDLDELQFSRKYKRSSYITETRLEDEGSAKEGIDIRTIDAHRD